MSARRRVQEVFGFDFADELSAESWAVACRVFQKRHLLAHKMGVIDAEYIVRVTQEDVSLAIGLIETLGQRLFKGLLAP